MEYVRASVIQLLKHHLTETNGHRKRNYRPERLPIAPSSVFAQSMISCKPITAALLLLAATGLVHAKPKDPFTYLDNETLRIGVDKSRGSAIGYFALTYRHHGDGSGGPDGSACSYVAPIRQFPLTKGLVVDYEFHLTIGSLDEIRARFAKLRK
jgi:hypothetical protein